MFKKTIYLVLGLIVSVCVLAGSAQAAIINPGPLSISYDGEGAIFSEINAAPGNEYIKELTITNNGVIAHSFALATVNVTGELADYVYIEPELYGVQLWSLTVGQLASLSEESQTVLPSIDPGESVSINLKARFDETATSEISAKNLTFDFVFGTQEAEPGVAVAVSDLTAGLSGATVSGVNITPTATPATTATVSSPDSGEVLGAKDSEGDQQGLNGLLLLIPAATLLVSVPFVAPGARNAILPTLGAGVTTVLAFFTHGNMQPNIFWAILIAEIILILLLDYFIVKKTVIEVLEEEEVLEKKARRARSSKRR
jgi:hypothetical protein